MGRQRVRSYRDAERLASFGAAAREAVCKWGAQPVRRRDSGGAPGPRYGTPGRPRPESQAVAHLGQPRPRVNGQPRRLGAIARARPDLVFYVAGVDVAAGDRLGRLSISRSGLVDREEIVLGAAIRNGLPLVTVLGGGYAENAEATAELHAVFHRAASRLIGAGASRR